MLTDVKTLVPKGVVSVGTVVLLLHGHVLMS